MKKIIVYLLIIMIGLSAYAAYRFERSMVRQRLAAIKLQAKPEVNLRIIEGWNLAQIQTDWKANSIIFSRDLKTEMAGAWSAEFSFLKDVPSSATLEGYLFPDTYRVYEGASSTDVIPKLLANFQNKVTPEMLADIKSQGRTLSDTVILASIIEKESGQSSDMGLVSGVFWNRLRRGQRLQSDATSAYAPNDKRYDTYASDGLPFSPIDNPGLAAIEAAIHPAKTDYLYFLTRPDTGAAVFSRTYDEHLRNINKYLK
jgi:UPF0755 protein